MRRRGTSPASLPRARAGAGSTTRASMRAPWLASTRALARRTLAFAVVLAACGAPQAPVSSPASSEVVQAPPPPPPLTAEQRAAHEADYQDAQKQLAAEWAALDRKSVV